MSDKLPVLYTIPASHPCAAVEETMRRKGIEFRRVEMVPLAHIAVGLVRYGGATVPGMRLGSERIRGSRAIMRVLDELAPDPPLLPPPGSAEYARVLEAERWGEELLQPVPRRIIDAGLLRRPAAGASYLAAAELPLPNAMIGPSLPLLARLMAMRNGADDESVREDIAALPHQLDRVDGWLQEGLLGGAEPNAADLQIGSTIRLLLSFGDVRPLIAGRPCERLAAYFPPLVGEIPAGTLPAQWLTPIAA